MEPADTLTRRGFATALVGMTVKAERRIAGGFADDGMSLGHLLRGDDDGPAIRRTVRVPVVIVGAGIAGLCAAWRLLKRGCRDFVVLEMNAQAGGNSLWGENEVSRYPWAAHYVPVPNRESVLARELLEELGAMRDGVPDERHLCHSPQERLYQHGRWHDGLHPEYAGTAAERAQFRRFSARVREMRATGEYTIPVAAGVKRSPLAAVSMASWMEREGFRSAALRWYVDYCCRDDYGALAADTSAWAGIHYFASREHDEEGPLTWPEGNGWIVRRLLDRLGPFVRTRAMVHSIVEERGAVRVAAADTHYLCERVIFTAPTFLARFVMDRPPALQRVYSPWVTANITLDRLPEERGLPVAWDNVVYGSPSLGYVNAMHQSYASRPQQSVWTWYMALAEGSPRQNRELLVRRSWNEWCEFILADLERAHRDIRACVRSIDVMRLGHAMARPVPGTELVTDLVSGRVHFANSDLTGLSLFEEAQWHGVRAADRVLGLIGG